MNVATLEWRMYAFLYLGRTTDMTSRLDQIGYDEAGRVSVVVAQPLKRQRIGQAQFLLNNQQDLIELIYLFIDGVETFRHLRINHFTANNLKQCIRRLEIPCSILRASGQPPNLLLNILQSCPQLLVLRIEEMDSLSCYDKVAIAGNVRVISQLAQALCQGMIKHLRCLYISLKCTFPIDASNQSASGTHELIEALSKGRHSQLVLLTFRQFLSQDMVLELADIIAQGKQLSLKILDLCGNSIDEQGARALWLALACNSTALCTLRVEGNILTDSNAKRLAKTLENSENMKSLKSIVIRGNFIGEEGRSALENVLKQDQCASTRVIA
jgi:hypothetical protein